MRHFFRFKSLLLLVMWMLLFIACTGHDLARAESGNIGKYGGGGPTLSYLNLEAHDVSAVYLMVSNVGVIGSSMFYGSGFGFFPSNTGNNYVFGTGLWFGARYDADADGDTDKVFTNGYIRGDTEFREGTNEQERDDLLARIFDSTDPDDLAEWPDRFRKNGEAYIRSDQDLVTTYTTLDKAPYFGEFQMPIEVDQRSLAFKRGLAGQAIVFIFDIDHWGEEVMEGSWIGYDSDMDVGASFSDDLSSFIRDWITPEGDTVHVNMAYAWDSDFSENSFTGHPGFVGITYLRSPGNSLDGIDNDGDGLIDESPFNALDDDSDGLVDEADEVDELGLVNYSKHCSPGVPCEVLDPPNDEIGYDIISCISDHNPDSTSDIICLESVTPADIRFMISSGPFDWLPGQKQQVVFAMVFANAIGNPNSLDFVGNPPRPDPNDPALSQLLAVKKTVQQLFDLDFQSTEPPPPPNLTLVPGDGQVTLLWDELPLKTSDPLYEEFVKIDPEYQQYDFQGYRVWRSRTGEFSRLGDTKDPDYPLTPEAVQDNRSIPGLDLTLLAQYDIADGITTESSGVTCADSIILLDSSVVYTECDTFNLGTDTGLRFSFVDRGDSLCRMTNGFRYYYMVSSYDYNSDALPVSRLSLDSGVSFSVESSAFPRSHASSFVDAFGHVLHVDSDGEVLDDTSSIFTYPRRSNLDPPEEVHATNALIDFQFNPGRPEKISDGYYTLVLDDFERIEDITNRIDYYVEEASGERMYTGQFSSFDLSYDGTDQALEVAVFDPEDSASVIFSSEFVFNVDAEGFFIPDTSELFKYFFAINPSGADIFDSLGTVRLSSWSYIPAGFRASDIVMEWFEAGAGSLTLEVTDLDNLVEVPFGDSIVVENMIAESEKGSNWSFLPIGGGVLQPGGRYFLTTSPVPIVDLWVCSFRITITSMSRMPMTGDIYTFRQVAYTMEVDTDVVPPGTTYVSVNRPLVPGTRYQIDTVSGGPEKGEVDLDLIRVVPNPYLASAAFDPGPDQRRLEFINLPPECTIRIYTISGNLVCKLEHTSDEGGTEAYNLKTGENLPIASGHYYYHVATPDGKTQLGRFAVVQ
jgi:hypothetical protein